MTIHELPRVFYHYEYQVGGVKYYSENKPTDLNATDIHFIKEGEEVGTLEDGSGVTTSIMIHTHERSATGLSHTRVLPVDFRPLSE